MKAIPLKNSQLVVAGVYASVDPEGGEEARMKRFPRPRRTWILLMVALALLLGTASGAGALDVGDPAPGFTLASTMGGDISLSDFRGQKWVLLEFYGADFAPT